MAASLATEHTRTVEEWRAIITGLTVKRQAAATHVEALRAEKRDLAPQRSAMGGADAKKKLDRINQELARADLEAEDFHAAIARAEAGERQSKQDAAAEAERTRMAQLRRDMQAYEGKTKEIDDCLRLLSSRFAEARVILDRAESIMTSQERTPIQQLRSRFGPTLAATHAGLAAFIELGPTAANIPHRQPLAQFTAAFTAGYTTAEKNGKGD